MGIAKALNGIAGRRLSKDEEVFYSTLLTYGGPLVHKFVSLNLQGPGVGTTRRHRTNGRVEFQLKKLEQNINQVCTVAL